MTGCIQQSNFSSLHGKSCLLGKDRDPAFPFQRIRIQKGILMIHTSYFSECPTGIQKAFGQGCLSRIYMCQKGNAYMIIFLLLCLLFHRICPRLSISTALS